MSFRGPWPAHVARTQLGTVEEPRGIFVASKYDVIPAGPRQIHRAPHPFLCPMAKCLDPSGEHLTLTEKSTLFLTGNGPRDDILSQVISSQAEAWKPVTVSLLNLRNRLLSPNRFAFPNGGLPIESQYANLAPRRRLS